MMAYALALLRPVVSEAWQASFLAAAERAMPACSPHNLVSIAMLLGSWRTTPGNEWCDELWRATYAAMPSFSAQVGRPGACSRAGCKQADTASTSATYAWLHAVAELTVAVCWTMVLQPSAIARAAAGPGAAGVQPGGPAASTAWPMDAALHGGCSAAGCCSHTSRLLLPGVRAGHLGCCCAGGIASVPQELLSRGGSACQRQWRHQQQPQQQRLQTTAAGVDAVGRGPHADLRGSQRGPTIAAGALRLSASHWGCAFTNTCMLVTRNDTFDGCLVFRCCRSCRGACTRCRRLWWHA